MTDVLQGVCKPGGTAYVISSTLTADQPVAGKTGTSENYRDLWFCGYTPQVSIAVWTGYRQEDTVTDAYGNEAHPYSVAVPVFVDYVNATLDGLPRQEFPTNGTTPTYKSNSEWTFTNTESYVNQYSDYYTYDDSYYSGDYSDGYSDGYSDDYSDGYSDGQSSSSDDTGNGYYDGNSSDDQSGYDESYGGDAGGGYSRLIRVIRHTRGRGRNARGPFLVKTLVAHGQIPRVLRPCALLFLWRHICSNATVIGCNAIILNVRLVRHRFLQLVLGNQPVILESLAVLAFPICLGLTLLALLHRPELLDQGHHVLGTLVVLRDDEHRVYTSHRTDDIHDARGIHGCANAGRRTRLRLHNR